MSVKAKVFHTGKNRVTVQLDARFIEITLFTDAERTMTDEQLIERAKNCETVGK